MADALNRRDIDMIFRAETDSATRNVGDLKKSVRDLRGELDRQIKAAEKGEVSLDDLAKTTRELKKAQDELGTARSLLTQLNTIEGGVEKTERRLAKLNNELGEYKTRQEAADKPSKALTRSITAKERAIAAATEKLDKDRAVLGEYKSQVEAVLGPVDRLEDSFREVALISKDAAQGLALTGRAADDFAAKARSAGAAAADLDAFKTFAGNAGLLQDDITYLAQFGDRIERVTALRNQQIAADLRYQDALERTQAEQAKLAQTNAFRQIAAESRDAFSDITRFQAGTVKTEQSVRRLATAVADLANPSRTAASNLTDVAATVEAVEKRVFSGKNRRVGELSNDLNAVEQALAGLQRQAGQVDGLRAQEAAVDRAGLAFNEARARVLDLARAVDASGTDELVAELRQAEAAAEGAGQAFQSESTKLVQLGTAAEQAGIDINQLAVAEQRITNTAQSAGRSADFLRKKLGGGTGSGAFLGLKPFELQNLGFQIQDIFVSLASGQNPLTVLAQQGSQIAQIFPGTFAALARLLPILGPLALGFTAVALGTARLAAQAQRTREVSAALTEVGNSSKTAAADVQTAIANLDELGASSEDAKKSILSLVKEGMDPAFFDDFSAAALNYSEITGKSLPEATERLVEGLTKGKDSVLALDNEFSFLSDSERTQIRAMDDSTDAAEIRTIAFGAFYDQAQDVAAELRGPSYDAVKNLESAWSDFLDMLADVAGFKGVDNWLADLTNGLAVFITFLSSAIRQVKGSFGELADVYNKAGGGVRGVIAAGGAINDIAGKEKSVGQLINEARGTVVSKLNARNNRERTSRGDVGRGTRGSRGVREKAEDKAAKDAEKARKKAESEAEKLARQLASDQESLQRQIETMTAKALVLQGQSVEQQLSAVEKAVKLEYAKLLRDLDEFTKKYGSKVKIGDLTQEQYRAQLQANEALIVQAEKLKVFETNLNQLLAERTSRLAAIEDRQNAGLITASEAYAQAQEVTSNLNPKIEKLADDAAAFARAIGGANPSPEMKAFLANIEGTRTKLAETQTDVTKTAIANLNEMEQKRNDIIQRRDNLIAANNELVKLGLLSSQDAREAAVAAFNREADALRELIRLERIYLATLLAGESIQQNEYAARMAQLDVLEQQTQYVDDRILQVNNTAKEAFAQGFTTMFNVLAQGFANIITGAGDVGDMLENLGMAALSFAADFLKAIADVLVQMIALQAVKAIFGASSGGLGALFFHSGTGPGGVGGYGGGRRSRSGLSISPLTVAAAPRYHNGTPGAGLKRDEVVSVLKRGERVVTEEQDRLEAKRQSRASGGGRGLKQVLAFGDEEVAGAMSGPAGEEVTVTHIRRNRTRIRQELGID